MKIELDLVEVKKQTMELFNLSESDVNYITEDFLNGDFEEFDKSFEFSFDKEKNQTYWNGHNVAYGRANNGRFTYVFLSGPQDGCQTNRYVFYQDEWDHYSTNIFCGGIQDERHRNIRFVRK